ncbi:MAG: transglycosylase domain-containing protein, partial [Cellulosilyticaceae bacterium]
MKNYFLRGIRYIMIIVCMGVFGILGVGYTQYQKTSLEMPVMETIYDIRQTPEYIEISDINQTFLDAIVAIEDHRFYDHGAIDMISLARATVKNLIEGEVVQGGSTITQQLAKNLFLSSDQTLMRK